YTFNTATRSGTLGDPLSGLTSSSGGTTHTFVWASDTDIGTASMNVPDAYLQITPNDGTSTGTAGVSSSFAMPLPIGTTPGAPTPAASSPTCTSISVTNNAADSSTDFFEITIGGGGFTLGTHFVQSGGTVGTTQVWQTKATWATKTVTGLAASTTYTFQLK